MTEAKPAGFVAASVLPGFFVLVDWLICFNNLKILRLLKSSFTVVVYLNTLEGEK